jgi:hypothetical protein
VIDIDVRTIEPGVYPNEFTNLQFCKGQVGSFNTIKVDTYMPNDTDPPE